MTKKKLKIIGISDKKKKYDSRSSVGEKVINRHMKRVKVNNNCLFYIGRNSSVHYSATYIKHPYVMRWSLRSFFKALKHRLVWSSKRLKWKYILFLCCPPYRLKCIFQILYTTRVLIQGVWEGTTRGRCTIVLTNEFHF